MRKILVVLLVWMVVGIVMQTPGVCSDPLLPEYYGAYAVSKGKLIELRDAAEEKRTILLNRIFSNVGGLGRLSGISLDPDSYFIYYKHLYAGGWGLQLMKFEFFPEVIAGKERASMWQYTEEIPLKMGQVPGNPDMFRAKPIKPLTNGIYAFSWFYKAEGGTLGKGLFEERICKS